MLDRDNPPLSRDLVLMIWRLLAGLFFYDFMNHDLNALSVDQWKEKNLSNSISNVTSYLLLQLP